jgi:hypothetical protein
MGKSLKQQYVAILSQIKQGLEIVDDDREAVFERFKDILVLLDKEHINIEEMCRYSGDTQAYYHNKYLISVLYLTLGECYDFALSAEYNDNNLAKKYYMLSDQPPAKWRLAKLYLEKKIRYDGDVNVIAHRLTREAIDSLIGELQNQKYFEKRLGYVIDMYTDISQMTIDSHDLYFDILQWVINNQQNVHEEHFDLINQLLTFDVPCRTPREDNLFAEVTNLM